MAENEDYKIIHEFSKNSMERVRVALTTYKGGSYIDLRVFYHAAGDEWRPSRKGLMVDTALLPKLAEAVERLKAAVEEEVGS